jgi:hypothetical protein
MIDKGKHVSAAVLPDGAAIDRAIARAHARTILRHRRLGIPLVIWRDDRVVEVSADDVSLPVPESELGEAPLLLGLLL